MLTNFLKHWAVDLIVLVLSHYFLGCQNCFFSTHVKHTPSKYLTMHAHSLYDNFELYDIVRGNQLHVSETENQ